MSSTSQSLSSGGTLTTLELVPQDAFVQRAEPTDTGGRPGIKLVVVTGVYAISIQPSVVSSTAKSGV